MWDCSWFRPQRGRTCAKNHPEHLSLCRVLQLKLSGSFQQRPPVPHPHTAATTPSPVPRAPRPTSALLGLSSRAFYLLNTDYVDPQGSHLSFPAAPVLGAGSPPLAMLCCNIPAQPPRSAQPSEGGLRSFPARRGFCVGLWLPVPRGMPGTPSLRAELGKSIPMFSVASHDRAREFKSQVMLPLSDRNFS